MAETVLWEVKNQQPYKHPKFAGPLIEMKIVSDPEMMQGAAVIKGTRIPAILPARLFANGTPLEEILTMYPRLQERHVRMATRWARQKGYIA